MDDLISRQAVDKIIDDLFENDNLHASPSVWHGLHMIKQLPSAQPERKVGKWILTKVDEDEYGNGTFNWVCSECGAQAYEFSQHYCHRCGAPMEVK